MIHENPPPGTQGIEEEEPTCSICKNVDTVHKKIVRWHEEYCCEIVGIIQLFSVGAVYYCQECFEEYGGNEKIKRK